LPVQKILKEFPEVIRTSIPHKQNTHGVEHVIKTSPCWNESSCVS